MSSWLTLQEYSNKQGISISTLRRKIKSQELEYTFKNGRYLLKAPLKKEELSKEDLQNHYQKLLNKKENELRKLKEGLEDLLQLVSFLEEEKIQLLQHLEKQNSPEL